MTILTGKSRAIASHRPPARRFGRALVFGLLAFSAALTATITPAFPPEGERGSDLTVGPASICRDVQEREPIDSGSTFPPEIGRLYCFTRVNGATGPTHVTHVWFHQDREVHRGELQVGGPSWRTWSYKTIPPEWTGAWRVDVEDADGIIIYSLPFSISAGSPDEEAPGDQPGR